MRNRHLFLVSLVISCSSTSPTGSSSDAASTKTVIINEVFAGGSSPDAPDWIELESLSDAKVELGGYKMRDNLAADLYAVPTGTSIDAHGFLVFYADDQADGGIAGGVHLPWKLSAKKGDEVHLIDPNGVEVDATIFGTDIPSDKSWGRLPDGTGGFVRTTPTEGKPNL